jgi:hypothetical protein
VLQAAEQQLPPGSGTAEYDRSGADLTLQQVLNDARSAAAGIAQTYSVLVTEGQRRMWTGLPQST